MRTTVLRLFLAFALVFSGDAAQSHAKTNEPITWVFLNTGSSREKLKGMSQDSVAKMQAAHVGNFGTQFNRGTLIAAGPLGDNGFIRGTVILAGHGHEQVAECFKTDPFVQNDVLAVEAHPWLVDVLKFHPPAVPFKLARHTLCVVKKGENWKPSQSPLTSDSLLRLFPSLKKQSRSGELGISGPFLDAGEKLGVLLFYTSNQTQIQAQMAKEPALVERQVELDFHPQFMGAGTLQIPGENLSTPKAGKRTQLFDGTTFAGWDGDTNHTWRVENQALIGGSFKETVPHNEFLSTTRQFRNFDLRLKVKLQGTGFVNGGIQLRSQRTTKPAFEMTGYQADAGEGYWGSLYDESRRDKVLAHTHAAIIKQILKTNDWNDYVIRCEGSHIRLWLNGVLTVDYTEDEKEIPLEGLIALQIHGGGKAQASYKEISIQELP
jgi:uncharacterized protein YciI